MSGIKLPVGYYFGVSAATGDLAGEFLARLFFILSYIILILCVSIDKDS